MKTKRVDLWADDKGNFYTSDVVTDWKQVVRVDGKLVVPRPVTKQVAVVEVRFRGEWTPVIDVMHPSHTPSTAFDVSEAINQIRVRYKKVL